jgi:hypothetical protein
MNDTAASIHVINVAAACDEQIGRDVKNAWEQTRDVMPGIIEKIGQVADYAADSFADIMVTRIIRDRYIYLEDSDKGLDSERCKGFNTHGRDPLTPHKLFGGKLHGGLLNSAITHQEPELAKKNERRRNIFATKALAAEIGEIIYNKKIDQDEIREAAEAASEGSQAPSAMPSNISGLATRSLIHASSAPPSTFQATGAAGDPDYLRRGSSGERGRKHRLSAPVRHVPY